MPSICWVPFAILWCGLNEKAVLFVVIAGSVFSMAMAFESSVRNVNPFYIRIAKNTGITSVRLYIDVIFPAVLPDIISGMKQGWSFSWRSLMAGEMMVATVGLGQILVFGRDLADVNQVVAVIGVIVMLGLLVDRWVFGVLEERIRRRWGTCTVEQELKI